MTYDLNKRLSELQDRLHRSQYHTISSWKTFFLATIFFTSAIWLLRSPHLQQPHVSQQFWLQSVHQQVDSRISFFSVYPFSSSFKETYYELAKWSVANFNLPGHYSERYIIKKDFDPFNINVDFSNFPPSPWNNFFTELILRVAFVLMALVPLWILAAIFGLASIKFLKYNETFDPVFSACDKKQSPFYSGIFGGLKISGKANGIETTGTGLACPGMVKPVDAVTHPITVTLKQFDAFCATTFDLTRVILEYKDFPCHVDEERHIDSEQGDGSEPAEDASSGLGIIENGAGTIESNAQEILPLLLLAHKTLKVYFKHYEKNLSKETAPDVQSDAHHDSRYDGDMFLQFKEQLKDISQGQPELSLTIMNLLTLDRARAFAQLSPKEVAAAYLAIEAGKCLVYERSDRVYLKISQFPHLQARAVLHSIQSYSSEFDTESRLTIRQAIICSRRHRDFARAFLPEKMSDKSKALRDILEVLYADKEQIKDLSLVTELDAHLDEILHNWQNNFFESVKNDSENAKKDEALNPDIGILHRSLVLVRQEKVLELALRGYGKPRLERIHRLMKHAKKFGDAHSVSARLPGFKQQIESENDTSGEKDKSYNWDLVKKMLTRYNWLSSRVDDDIVPKNGSLYSIVADKKNKHVFEFETLVPLRQRRMKELFGSNWEKKYYQTNVRSNEIFIFANKSDYEEKLRKMKPRY